MLPEENLRAIEALRIPAMRQKGYVSGETLVNADDPRQVVVVSTWSDVDGFNAWAGTDARKELDSALAPHLDEPARINAYMLGADAIDQMFETIIHDAEVES